MEVTIDVLKIVSCEKCGTELSNDHLGRVLIDVDSTPVGIYCVPNDCFQSVACNLMSKRFYQQYLNNMIYEKNGNFYPSWKSPYYFKSLQECLDCIDLQMKNNLNGDLVDDKIERLL